MKDKILAAAKADMIPEGAAGLWEIGKWALAKELMVTRSGGRSVLLPPGGYTSLFRYTESTMHLIGECVMHDTPEELAKHLDFMLKAHGHVLITGLGLGCVLRGCLANPAVKKITLIERDSDVLKLVKAHVLRDEVDWQRVEIIQADALEWVKQTPLTFDSCWHDIWTDTDAGEMSLSLAHSRLLSDSMKKVKFQGAWDFPRCMRSLYQRKGFPVL